MNPVAERHFQQAARNLAHRGASYPSWDGVPFVMRLQWWRYFVLGFCKEES